MMALRAVLIVCMSVIAFLVFSEIEPGAVPLAKVLLYLLGPFLLIRILSGLIPPANGKRAGKRIDDAYTEDDLSLDPAHGLYDTGKR